MALVNSRAVDASSLDFFFLLLWAAWPSAVFPAEPATTDDAVWEIESLEPGDFDYNLNEGRVVLNDRFRITFKEQGESAFVIADKGQLNQRPRGVCRGQRLFAE